MTAEHFAARLKQANLVTKTDFDDRLKSLNQNITSNKIKHLIVESELKKLRAFGLYRCFNRVIGVGSGNYIYSWKSKELSDENITAPTTSDYKLKPELSFFGTKTKVEFNGSCLKQDKITYNHGKVVNIYIL